MKLALYKYAIIIINISFINLTLDGNPWKCAACAGPTLRKWLAQHAGIVSDAAHMHCNESHLPALDIKMDTLEYAQCVNTTHTLSNTRWGITAGLAISLVFVLISLVLNLLLQGSHPSPSLQQL